MNNQIKTFYCHIPYNSYKQLKFSLFHILTFLCLWPGQFFKLFWHHWLCHAHQAQQLIPDYCLSLPDPRGMTPTTKSGLCLLWAHWVEFICLWRNVHLQADHPETFHKWCTERSCSATLLGSGVTFAAAGTHSSGKPRACLCYTHSKRTARLLQVPTNNTGLTLQVLK